MPPLSCRQLHVCGASISPGGLAAPRIMKGALMRAGIDAKDYSGHNMRPHCGRMVLCSRMRGKLGQKPGRAYRALCGVRALRIRRSRTRQQPKPKGSMGTARPVRAWGRGTTAVRAIDPQSLQPIWRMPSARHAGSSATSVSRPARVGASQPCRTRHGCAGRSPAPAWRAL